MYIFIAGHSILLTPGAYIRRIMHILLKYHKEAFMNKFIAAASALLICLPALINFTSCHDPGNEINPLIMGLAGQSEPAVYLFQVSSSHNGDFLTDASSRADLDQLALAAYQASYSNLHCREVHAFISVAADDEIRDLGIPADLPVKSPDGTVIANDRADLLDGSINTSLGDAGVVENFVSNYWTGATSEGGLHGWNCTNWTSTASNGTTGSSGSITDTWLIHSAVSCGSVPALVGVCW